MLYFKIYVNQGNENLGIEKTTITANEAVKTAEMRDLAEQIHLLNPLIPIETAQTVLNYLIKASVTLMGMGFAIQFKNGEDVMLRISPDIDIAGGCLDLERAKVYIPEITELTAENAMSLVQRTGVSVKIKAECMSKFSKMISDRATQCEGVVVRDKILRKVSETTIEEPIDTSTGTIDTSTGTTVDTSAGTEPGNGGDDIPTGNG